MDQVVVNWILGGVGGLMGFILSAVWQSVKDLQVADVTLAEKVQSIEVLVAGSYVKRDDLDKLTLALFAKLDKIERLGRKEFVFPNNAKQKHGYYVQYHFEADPNAISEVEAHLKLNEQVMLQHYRRL